MIKESRAYKYADWVVCDSGKETGKYIKKQCEEWLKIANGDSDVAYTDESAYARIEKILKLIIHPDLKCDMNEGLESYAHLFITALLCTKERNPNEDIRYYDTGVLEIARKNFKTFTAAVIFILLLLTEPRFSRFFSVAPDLALSSELKVALNKIIKSSPALYSENFKAFKLLRREQRCILTESVYEPLAYSKDSMDGRMANAFLADESGLLDAYPVEAMRSSQIILPNKLGIVISTQYPNDNNVFVDEIDISKKVLDGLLELRYFSLLYEPDEELYKNDGWMTNDLVLKQSNPVALNHERIFKNLKEKRSIAILYEDKRENFLCKHCNIRYKSLGTEGYIEVTKVIRCRIEPNPEFWIGKKVFLGLDLSQTDDNTALAMVCEHEGEIYAKIWGFIPKDKKEIKIKKEHLDYNRMIEQGDCYECGDEVINYAFVEEFVTGEGNLWEKGLEKRMGVEIEQIGYDRYNAISSVQKLEAAGYECVEIKQHSSVLHRPTKFLKEKILSQEFHYESNRLLEINFENARCTEDTNLNKYVNKKKSSGKVDLVVALINAVYLLQQAKENEEKDFVIQC